EISDLFHRAARPAIGPGDLALPQIEELQGVRVGKEKPAAGKLDRRTGQGSTDAVARPELAKRLSCSSIVNKEPLERMNKEIVVQEPRRVRPRLVRYLFFPLQLPGQAPVTQHGLARRGKDPRFRDQDSAEAFPQLAQGFARGLRALLRARGHMPAHGALDGV